MREVERLTTVGTNARANVEKWMLPSKNPLSCINLAYNNMNGNDNDAKEARDSAMQCRIRLQDLAEAK